MLTAREQDTVTGMLLAGIGVSTLYARDVPELITGQHVTAPPDSQRNFLVVDSKTENSIIEQTFDRFTSERKDIGILLINQHVRQRTSVCYRPLTLRPGQVAERIRHRVDSYTAAFPALLEIPSKEHPYDPEKDSVLRRVRRLFGE